MTKSKASIKAFFAVGQRYTLTVRVYVRPEKGGLTQYNYEVDKPTLEMFMGEWYETFPRFAQSTLLFAQFLTNSSWLLDPSASPYEYDCEAFADLVKQIGDWNKNPERELVN